MKTIIADARKQSNELGEAIDFEIEGNVDLINANGSQKVGDEKVDNIIRTNNHGNDNIIEDDEIEFYDPQREKEKASEARVDLTNEIAGMDSAMRDYGSKKWFVNSGGTQEYGDLKREAVTLQEMMRSLNGGIDKNGYAITGEKRVELIKQAKAQAEIVQGLAKDYIDKKPDSPLTPWGQSRRNGANMIRETAAALATKLQNQLDAATQPAQNIERAPAGPKAGQGMVNETNAEKLSEKLGMNNGQVHDKKMQNVNNSNSKVISTNANGHTNGTKQSLPGQNGHT